MRFSGFQELLEHYAAVSPDAPALIYEDREKKVCSFSALKKLVITSLNASKTALVQFVSVNQDGFLSRVQSEIKPIRIIRPTDIQRSLCKHHGHKPQGIDPSKPAKGNDAIQGHDGKKLRQRLCKYKCPDSRIAYQIAVICSVEEQQKRCESNRNIIVIAKSYVD